MLAIRRRTTYLFLAISLGHILLISAQVQSKSGLPVIQAVAFGAFAKVQQVLASTADVGRSLWSNYVALHGVVKENDTLRRHSLELEGQLQQMQAMVSHTQALERALAMKATVPAPSVAARVIAGDPSPGSLTVTIDRGTDDGVQTDMAVVGTGGLVGRVINRPLPHAAQVQLIVGRNAGAAIVFERTGAGGFASGGSGDPPLRAERVANSADVKVGDRALTSGQDNLFPSGYLVGTVERAERRAGAWTIAIKPAVDFSHIDIVLVVLEKPARPAIGGGS